MNGEKMMRKSILFVFLLINVGFLVADDKSEVINAINSHWKYQNEKNWKKFVSTLHTGGTMNGDSNGSFWFRQESTVSAITANGWGSSNNKFNFKPRYIEVDVLETGKVAIAYYYLVGSYTINGSSKNDYRTRVSQVFIKESGSWKVNSGHFTQLHGGSGFPSKTLLAKAST